MERAFCRKTSTPPEQDDVERHDALALQPWPALDDLRPVQKLEEATSSSSSTTTLSISSSSFPSCSFPSCSSSLISEGGMDEGRAVEHPFGDHLGEADIVLNDRGVARPSERKEGGVDRECPEAARVFEVDVERGRGRREEGGTR
jgi:hypothetical protein